VGVVASGIDCHSLADAIEKCAENIKLLSENCYGVIERYDNRIFETQLIKVFNEL
jgi:acyl-CoA synthetase (NDP forming)